MPAAVVKVDFLYASRLEDYKGIQVMLEAFNELACDGCYLYICGDGNFKESVIAAAKRNDHIKYYVRKS